LLAWVAVEINALKFEYFLCISKAALPTKESLETFVSDALRVYTISLNADKERGDEACILAVIGLVKLHHFSADFEMDETFPEQESASTSSEHGRGSSSSQAYLVQAVCLLEFLRSNSPHNYGAVLLSILISQLLGLTSLSMKLMKNLRIKEIQHDTIDHLLYSRISITHPFPTSARHIAALADQYKNPHVGLGIALEWYDVAGSKMMQFMGDDLEDIQFDKIFEFAEFKERFENSFSRALMLLEYRRVARMTDQQRVTEGLPPQFEKWVIDNREFETIPDFEYAEIDKFESFITTRPRPEVRSPWIHYLELY
jgi:N-terminal acetyltransferase B complex non-catalytic subunit